MEGNRTFVARADRVAQGRPAASIEPSVPDRDYLRAQDGLALELAASGVGLRQRGHLLAAAARLDARTSLAATASLAAALLGKAWLAPVVAGRNRQRFDARSFRGDHTGPNPTDRSKKGCKRHVITDARGVPLVIDTGPANQPDGVRAIALLDRIPAVAGRRGRPRKKPQIFQGDAAYGTAANIKQVIQRGIRPLLAAHGKSHKSTGSGLGKTRYVVERTLSWFGNFRRIKFCYERTAAHFQAFHELAAALICFKKLTKRKRVLK